MPLPRVLFPASAAIVASGPSGGGASASAGIADVLDLPEAELRAAGLDGELFALGDGYCPSDVLVGPAERLHSVLQPRSRRLAAEGLTAAWVWGALPFAPRVLRLCCTLGSRAEGSGAGVEVRELTLRDDELLRLDGLAVTSPLRTLVDIARDPRDLEHGDAALHALLRRADVGIEAALTRLAHGRGLPGRRLATARLRRIEHESTLTDGETW
ncbi:hypothetical protein GCM10027515_21250 [Schumannella luteola]|uniref:AbiEi antitoxin C-terminal domain-containing protein n=1 Tax=Schumannella luteola TaxID=472059 RepID=A0A852YQT7_9MICO|nr:hypothetical protein [Schumannella luteola]NYH00080.1 hypothetical protein [Schumannella luteola]TPX06633.1 hypothetical protein FJ656_00345 [Schumannella luteola]